MNKTEEIRPIKNILCGVLQVVLNILSFNEIFQEIFTKKKLKKKKKKKKKTGLNACVCSFSVDYRAFDFSNIINIHKNLMKKHYIK